MVQNVLLVENSFGFGGSTVALTRLLHALDTSRFRPHVVVEHASQADHIRRFAGYDLPIEVRPRPPARSASGGSATRPRGRIVRLAGTVTSAWATWRRASTYARELEALARPWGIALVHLNNNVSVNMGGVLLARRLGVPCVVKQHGYDWHSIDVRRLARRVAHFMPDSNSVAEDLRRLGVPAERMTVTWCPVPMNLYGDDALRADVRRELGIPPAAHVVLMNGCMLRWKGHHVFLEAAARVLADDPTARALLVGDVPAGAETAYREELICRVRELGLAGRIHFAGHRDDVPRLLAAVDVCVHASVLPEPFGMVIVEAMAARRPVIATRAGGPTEIIRDGETGFLVTPGSVDETADTIRRLFADRDLRARIGNAARDDVCARFGLDRHARLTETIYERALLQAAAATVR